MKRIAVAIRHVLFEDEHCSLRALVAPTEPARKKK